MGIRKYKPVTNGRRTASVSDFAEITKDTPERGLVEKLPRHGGRNHHGLVTARYRGGGHPRYYRTIDFKRDKDGVPAKVAAIEYDPNRSSRIALLHYADGEKRYILWPKDIKVGDTVQSGERVEPMPGNCMPIKNIPVGLMIHNVELNLGKGGQFVRSAGGFAQLQAKEGEHALLAMPSGEIRKVSLECRATIGQLGNIDHNNIVIGKAGRNRWLGWKPKVRGSCRNPVDHPMGGGEGRRAGGRHPVGPWGQLAKGGKTRKPKALTNKFIVRGRKRER